MIRLASIGTSPFILSTALAISVAGCGAVEDDLQAEIDDIANALEEENGGLDMADEAPLFGDEDLFDRAEEIDTDVVYDDPTERDAEVAVMLERPDAVLYRTTILWGQFPGNPAVPTPRSWTGRFETNRGAILVRRIIRFEEATDHVLPRTDPRRVDFTSATRPHHDGLSLVLVDPEPGAEEPFVLRYLTPEGEVFMAPVPILVDGPTSEVVDDLGNRIVALALPRPVDGCEHGFLAGRWHKVAEHRGRLVGRVMDADGVRIGHMRGIYGRRRSGEAVFFGKFIDRDGRFRGIFRGRYGEGHFEGRWLTRTGEAGALGGEYRETLPGPEVGGHFLGRWAEHRCDVPTGPGVDLPE
jgi:hypothetical protein